MASDKQRITCADRSGNAVFPIAGRVIHLHDCQQLFCGQIAWYYIEQIQIIGVGAAAGISNDRFINRSPFSEQNMVLRHGCLPGVVDNNTGADAPAPQQRRDKQRCCNNAV